MEPEYNEKAEREDLEEGEIRDSAEGEVAEMKTSSKKWTGQVRNLPPLFRGRVKRKNRGNQGPVRADGSQIYQKRKKTSQFANNVRTHNIRPSTKDSCYKFASHKRKVNKPSTSGANAVENPVPAHTRWANKNTSKTEKRPKLVPRKFFQERKCLKGSDCTFSHPSLHPEKKQLCKFYSKGHCTKGNECHYMHEEFASKYYHTGTPCRSKENCTFTPHKKLTKEIEELLDKGSLSISETNTFGQPRAERRPLLELPPSYRKKTDEIPWWQMKELQDHGSAFQIKTGPVNVDTSANEPMMQSCNVEERARRSEISDLSLLPRSDNEPYLSWYSADANEQSSEKHCDWDKIYDMVSKISPKDDE